MQQRTKIALAVAIALQSMISVAQAQEAMQRVEVTGSRIRQVDLETAQPVQVMTQEQIQKTGLVTVGDIIANMSSAGSPAFSKGGSLTSNRENGGQYANLRNLGTQRLLVLVNGKRWTQTVAGLTDMSTIPSSMIERLEILKDGASSIYGSDAIAGVINIILKKSMEGGQLSLYTGQNESVADGKNKDFSLTYGAGNEKASLMFGLSHTEAGAVWSRDREFTSYSRTSEFPLEGLGGGPWGRIRQVAANGGPTGFDRILNHTGDQLGEGQGQDSRNPNSYHTVPAAGPIAADNFNTTRQMVFAMPSKLDTIFTKGELQLPYDMRFVTTAMYASRKGVSTTAGYPLNSQAQSKYPVYIDKDSYYNPFGNQVAGAGLGQDLYFYRRTIEVPRVTENTNRTLHIDATLSGDFELRSLPWNWSVGYNHSKVDGNTMATGNINLLNLKKALGPSFRNAAGVIQCGTAAAPIALAECTPFDILGGPSASTPAALNYIMSIGGYTYGSKVDSATADLSGELFQLPAGALGVAAGIEHRTVEGWDLPGEFQRSGFSTDLAGNPTSGRYTVREAYAELNIPILKSLPFIESLSANLATRYSDYSNFGSTNNSKASLTYRPTKDLLFRGTWAEGFRAPTVGDSFGGGQQSFDSYLDPCDTVYGDAARNTTVLGRCNTGFGGIRGTPASFRQKTQTGANITSSSSVQSAVPFNVGAGNAFLQPETAVTRTLGAVFNPSFVPGFSAAVDWYSIQIDNRILSVSSNTILDECYNKGQTNFCALVFRDATGSINDIRRGNVNFGQIKTEGVDVELRYRLPRFSWGQVNLRSETTYLDEYSTKSGATAQWIDYSGDYDFHRWKSNFTADWSLGNLSATWGVRYLSSVTDQCLSIPNRWQCNDLTTTRPGATSAGANRLSSLVFHDISVGYKLPWNANVRAGVNNAFDKKPRFTVLGAASSTYVDADLPIDRFIYVRYNQNF
ncbi:TonB-dependent receptor [Massilia sp. IC2-477]|uniref:TonB-dependent receptor domain-containing protein n=1 Tax=unclassified Massilia TaxID=2609279 RepID=UPI001D0F8D9F|nr:MULTISPECIES: TonB-dependent receptor [unclassified Massilia]MCC2954273.1 TonB-dependent receptor [Massilia sp. IC2-477]MCC2971712.1 TonB-dependent receptor [Massilia sp. IC2-476]